MVAVRADGSAGREGGGVGGAASAAVTGRRDGERDLLSRRRQLARAPPRVVPSPVRACRRRDSKPHCHRRAAPSPPPMPPHRRRPGPPLGSAYEAPTGAIRHSRASLPRLTVGTVGSTPSAASGADRERGRRTAFAGLGRSGGRGRRLGPVRGGCAGGAARPTGHSRMSWRHHRGWPSPVRACRRRDSKPHCHRRAAPSPPPMPPHRRRPGPPLTGKARTTLSSQRHCRLARSVRTLGCPWLAENGFVKLG